MSPLLTLEPQTITVTEYLEWNRRCIEHFFPGHTSASVVVRFEDDSPAIIPIRDRRAEQMEAQRN